MKTHKFHRAPALTGRKTKNNHSRYRSWHRRLGLSTCVLLLLLAVTGILINHAHHLGLDKQGVEVNWLLDYYGIGQPNNIKTFALQPSPLLGIDNQLWLDDKLILESSLPLLAALPYQQQIVAIDATQLYIFDQQGQLLEVQNSSTGLSPPLTDILLNQDEVLLLNTQNGWLLGDEQLLDWRSVESDSIDKIMALTPLQTTSLSPAQLTRVRSKHLAWERVILDLHSGRLFGSWAIWLWDLFALALVVLTLSGIWMWQHKKVRR